MRAHVLGCETHREEINSDVRYEALGAHTRSNYCVPHVIPLIPSPGSQGAQLAEATARGVSSGRPRPNQPIFKRQTALHCLRASGSLRFPLSLFRPRTTICLWSFHRSGISNPSSAVRRPSSEEAQTCRPRPPSVTSLCLQKGEQGAPKPRFFRSSFPSLPALSCLPPTRPKGPTDLGSHTLAWPGFAPIPSISSTPPTPRLPTSPKTASSSPPKCTSKPGVCRTHGSHR